VVVAAGAIFTLAAPRRASKVALATTGFGILGTAVGILATVAGGRHNITGDLVYHSLLMAALLITFVFLLRPVSPQARLDAASRAHQ
jgi:hypothetical protein